MRSGYSNTIQLTNGVTWCGSARTNYASKKLCVESQRSKRTLCSSIVGAFCSSTGFRRVRQWPDHDAEVEGVCSQKMTGVVARSRMACALRQCQSAPSIHGKEVSRSQWYCCTRTTTLLTQSHSLRLLVVRQANHFKSVLSTAFNPKWTRFLISVCIISKMANLWFPLVPLLG